MKFKVTVYFTALQPLPWTFLSLLPPRLMFNLYKIAQVLWFLVTSESSLEGDINASFFCRACIEPLTVFFFIPHMYLSPLRGGTVWNLCGSSHK